MALRIEDLRYSIRALGRSPGVVLAVVLSLGLGIGATTAVFSFVNAIQFKPLPFTDPDSLVGVSETSATELCAAARWAHPIPLSWTGDCVRSRFPRWMIKTVLRTYEFDVGYDASRVLAGDIALSGPAYDDPQRTLAFVRTVLDRLGRIPGVNVAASRTVFFAGFGSEPRRITVDGLPSVPAGASPSFYHAVTPGYFAALAPAGAGLK